jgi:hypothetical protein
MKFKFETERILSNPGSIKEQFFQKSLHRKDWN